MRIVSVFILMGILCFSMFSFAYFASSSSEVPAVEWNKTYGGALHDETRSVIQTSDGGYAMAGWTNSFGYESNSAFWLVKTDSEGNMLWNQTYSDSYVDKAFSVMETSDGGYVVSGHSGDSDGLVIKTDANGNMLWNKTFGVRCERMIKTSDGGFAIFADTPAGIIKIDAIGTVQWSKAYSGYAYQLIQTSDGGYALTGLKPNFPVAERQVWLLRTDVNGDLLWERTYGGLAYAVSHGYSFVQMDDGGFSIVAAVESVQGAPVDAWLFKTDADGNMIWNRTFGGANDDNPYWMIQTKDKGYAIAGFTNSYGAGDYDFSVLKTDAIGNLDWNQTYGGINNDQALSIIQTADNGYAVAGITLSFGAGNFDFWLIKLAGPKTWIVDDDGPADFSTIQEAINAASDGDTVFVRAGVYHEHIIIGKVLSLYGENKTSTIIDGNGAGLAVDIESVNVTFEGFTVQNACFGIGLGNANYCTVSGNIVRNTLDEGENGSNGIELGGPSDFNNIIGNIVTNIGSGDPGNGIIVYSGSNNTISSNNVSECYVGIVIYGPAGNIVLKSALTDNDFGLMFLTGSHDNTIVANTVSSALYAILQDSSFNNSIYHNNFLNASQFVISTLSSNFWDNGCEGNYWSDYTAKYPNATQVGNSGIWDTPYEIDANNIDHYPLANVYWSPCDINHDLKIDMKDIGAAARAFGTVSGDPLWNPHADITGPDGLPDGKVDMRDVGYAARHFGDHYP